MGIADHLICLLRNLYAGQEATDRTGHETSDWFKTRKGVQQGSMLSVCLFYFHEEHIMSNARLDGSQTRIKIARKNINNLRYPDDTTLMAESEEELKSLLKKVKEEGEKALAYSFLNLEPIYCSIQGSNCCFLTRIQVSRETGKVIFLSL